MSRRPRYRIYRGSYLDERVYPGFRWHHTDYAAAVTNALVLVIGLWLAGVRV